MKGKTMEAKIKIVVDEERAMERVKASIGRMKVKKNLWILCGVLTPPLLIDTCIRIYQYRYNFGMLFIHVIMGIVEGIWVWFCVRGNELRLIHQAKRKMKKMNCPFEQFLSFDDKQIEMESANQTRRFYWESIETVCEDDKHWFLGHEGLVIEKELLTKEQLEFVKKKCDAIKNHSKWM